MEEAKKNWDEFWDFYKQMQKELNETKRGIYMQGLQPTTNGTADGNTLFDHFLIANGGHDIVTPDGRAHLDDRKVKEAVIKSLTYITTSYKEGYVPPGALSWSDADDNNAFHAKQILMNLDGTISTEVAMFHEKDKYNDVITLGLGNDNAGQTMRATRCEWGLHRQEREERRGRQGLPEIRDLARCAEYRTEDRAGPLPAADAASGEGGSVLA